MAAEDAATLPSCCTTDSEEPDERDEAPQGAGAAQCTEHTEPGQGGTTAMAWVMTMTRLVHSRRMNVARRCAKASSTT